MNSEQKKWDDLDGPTVYGELYSESRRFRDYQLEFAKWCISIMLAFAGGYLALTTHGYSPRMCIRIFFAVVICLLAAATIAVIHHADFRFKEIKNYTDSIQPEFMRFKSVEKWLKPHVVMICLILLFTLVVCFLIVAYPSRNVLASQDVPPKVSPQSSVSAAGTGHVIIDSLPRKDIWDHASVIATIALAVIGAITFGVVWYQAVETKKAAEAAAASVKEMSRQAAILERQTQAVINAERAWIVVSVESSEPNKFNFRATNVGKTAAKVTSIWSGPITFLRDHQLEIPSDEKTGESLLSTPPCLLPPTDSQIVLRCNIGELGPGQYVGPDASARVQNDIQKGFRMLYFYGRIIYSDTLDEKSLHETKWLYWYVPVGEGAEAIPDPRHPELNSYS